jgi:4-hydroxy-tetrahydrodipicolinate reductase
MPDVEIIELHHENKVDSPSGTALMTAGKIAAARVDSPKPPPSDPVEKIPGARGASLDSIPIHSVRLPGYVAHQEVIFGGLGQTLTIRHDSIDRRSFMPGVILAIRKVRTLDGLVVGLDRILGDA